MSAQISYSRSRVHLFLAFACVAALVSATANAGARGISGQAAPEWDIESWYNLPAGTERLTLADLEGKVVYLFCFQAWCPGCHSHGFPTLKKVYETFKDDPKVAFLAVQTVFEGFDSNTATRAEETMKRYELPIPLGHDVPRDGARLPSVMRGYRTGGTPWTVIIDPEGIVRFDGFSIRPELAIRRVRELRGPSKPAS